jgi:hypothetical protein
LEDNANAELFSVRFLELGTTKEVTLYKPDAGTMEGTFNLADKVKPGTRYALCFSNDDKDEQLDMDVGFSIRVTSNPRTLPDAELGPDNLRALALVNKATAIHEDWSSLLDHFDFLRNREATHKQISDATMSRIERWTWIEAMLVVTMATAQVLYWRKFFETRRYL